MTDEEAKEDCQMEKMHFANSVGLEPEQVSRIFDALDRKNVGYLTFKDYFIAMTYLNTKEKWKNLIE